MGTCDPLPLWETGHDGLKGYSSCCHPCSSVFPMEVRTTEEYASADAELVLSIALDVSEFGVEVVCLQGADPDVPGYGDVEATADGEGEGSVVARWQFANGCGKVAVEAVDASEQRLAKGLEAGVVGHAHPQAAHAVEKAQARVEVGEVPCGVSPHFGDG